MCTEHQTTLKVINRHIDKGDSFTYDELTNEIVNAGGILRTSIGVTIRMYLERMQAIGLLVFDATQGKFIVHKEALKRKASMAS